MTAATSHRGVLIGASLLTFGLVFTGFLTLETPGLGIANFYYFAVALVALALGPYFGAAAGGAAAGLYSVGIVLNSSLPTTEVLAQSAWIRLLTYAGIGFLIGYFAQRNQELVVQLRLLAERDALTGLPNTRGFEAAMSRRLAGGRSFALLLGDMDGLKLINDSRGHAEGNDVLQRLAAVLGQALRGEDEVARVGGDEFAVLSSVHSGEEAASWRSAWRRPSRPQEPGSPLAGQSHPARERRRSRSSGPRTSVSTSGSRVGGEPASARRCVSQRRQSDRGELRGAPLARLVLPVPGLEGREPGVFMERHLTMRRVLIALAGLVLAGSIAAPASGALRLAPVASGFSNPVHLASTRAYPGRLYVVEQGGVIRIVQDGQVQPTPFLNVSDLVSCCGERGLLSLAFHPRFAQNHRVFVNYTNRAGDTRVVGFRTNASGTRALRPTLRVWLGSTSRTAITTAARSRSEATGVSMSGWVTEGRQAIRRIAPSASRPASASFCASMSTGPAPTAVIVAIGFRNPWRFSVDPSTGLFYLADVGQGDWEEIDVFRPTARGLENYGWRVYEGNRHVFDNSRGLRRPSVLKWPIHEYSHGAGRCSVTGGFVGRGGVFPSGARGQYFFGDYCTGDVWSFRWARGHKSGFRREPFTVPGNLSSFGRGANGAIYLLSHNGGSVYRLAVQ